MDSNHIEAFEQKSRIEHELGNEAASNQDKKHASQLRLKRGIDLAAANKNV